MMGKVAKSSRITISLFVIGFVILCAYLVFAAVGNKVSMTPVTANQSQNRLYNVSINNTDVSVLNNITLVNITLPAGFSFVADSNGSTDSSGGGGTTFTNTSNVLIWNKTAMAVTNGTTSTFWFNATASATAGSNFNVTIISAYANLSVANYTNVTVTVVDVTAPNISFITPTPANGANVSQTSIAVNVSVMENTGGTGLGTIRIYLYNSTYSLINNTNETVSGSINTTYVSFLGLSEGIYYLNATVNDTSNNMNSTGSGTRTIRLDTTKPGIMLGATGNITDYANLSQSTVFINVTNIAAQPLFDTYFANITYSLYNSAGLYLTTTFTFANATSGANTSYTFTGIPEGIYTYNVTVADSAGNTNTTQTLHITLESTNPVISLSQKTKNRNTIALNVGASATSGIANCTTTRGAISGSGNSWTVTESGLPCETGYEYKITCTDYASRQGSSETMTFATDYCGGGSGGGGSGSSATWITTTITSNQLTSGYSKSMGANERIKLSVSNQDHYVAVNQVSGTSALITVSSTEQQAALSVGQSKEFEVTGDNYYDIKVTLNGISGNKANVTVIQVYDLMPAEQNTGTGSTTAPGNEQNAGATSQTMSNKIVYIGIIALIVIVVLIFLVRKFAKKSGRKR